MTEAHRNKLKKRVLEELAESPIVETACKKAGLSRAQFYRWRASNEEFENESDIALSQGRERINDLAESRLIQGLNEGKLPFLRYWLSHNHHRYVQQKNVPLPYATWGVRKPRLWQRFLS